MLKTAATEAYLLLLPLFFVLHGYNENREAMFASDALALALFYVAVAIGVCILLYLLFRNWRKASLFAFGLLSLHFFFGPVHDALKSVGPLAFLSKYSLLLPLLGVSFALFFVLLLRTKRSLRQPKQYLVLLFIALLALELVFLAVAQFRVPPATATASLPFRKCDTCAKPDIYLIVADEYPDSSSLQQAFGFNNGSFLAALRTLGFQVLGDSRSNHNFTPYAMAALFRMDYLDNLDGSKASRSDINRCYREINENTLLRFFEGLGYTVYNHSIFNVRNQPASVQVHNIATGTALITSQTFLHRLYRDLGYHLVTTLKLSFATRRLVFTAKRKNDEMLDVLRTAAGRRDGKPQFVYVHLLMPHYPYYNREDGSLRPLDFLRVDHQQDKQAFVAYLQYCNKVFLTHLADLLQRSAEPPLVLFMGDHGFRWYQNPVANHPFLFGNLNAVYLPGKKPSPYYPGMTGVNQFRVLLNSQFGQQLPLVKDTTIFISE